MALTVPFATASDLEARWRSLTPAEEAQATVLLGDASQLILDEDRRGVLADLVDPASTTLARIVCAMVKRAMLAGDRGGADQVQQSAGPFSVATTFSNPAGDLYLTSAERRALRFTSQRAGSVDMWIVPDA